MRRTIIPAAGLLIWLALRGPAAGQNVASLPEPGITIHTTVNEVLLDLVVRDKHGRAVKNLKPGEVEIYEDGVRRDLLSFRLVAGADAVPDLHASEQKHDAPVAKSDAPGASRPAGPLSRSLRALNVACIVFHNVDPNTRKYAVEGAEEFLKDDLQPGTWVGIFNLDDRLTPLHQFTTNREEMLEAVKNVSTGTGLSFMSAADAILSAEPIMVAVTESGSAGPGGGSITTDLTITGGELNTQGIYGADVATSMGANMRRGDQVGQRRQFGHIEGMRETDQILLMIEQLARLPGRKTVLLFSPGLVSAGDPERFESILAKANRSDISFYAVDITGLTQNSNVLASNAAVRHVASLSQSQRNVGDGPAVMMEKMRQDDYLLQAVRTTDTQASLRALAEGTGGFLIGSTNDLKKPFEHVIEEMDTHYEAVYRPASDKYDGHLRKIEVKLARPDLTVESRPGYFALPDLKGAGPLTTFDVLGLLALDRQPRPHAFDFRSAAFQFRPEGGGSQYAVTYEVPVSSLTATAEPEQKRHRLRLSLVGLVRDASGQVVDKFSQDTPYEIPDDKLATIQSLSIPYTHLLDLPPGHYMVETAVLDREGNREAANEVPIASSGSKGIGLSSVMLVRQVEAAGQADAADPFRVGNDRVTPELETTLSASAKPYVYFVIYPDKASEEPPRLMVHLLQNGQVLAKRLVELPAPDATGAIPMVLGAAATPGACEMRITAFQGAESLTRSVKYTVAAE
jgi:VWFA-related protein